MRRLLTSHDLSLRLLSAVGGRNEFEDEEEQGVSEGDINDGVSENFTQSVEGGPKALCGGGTGR